MQQPALAVPPPPPVLPLSPFIPCQRTAWRSATVDYALAEQDLTGLLSIGALDEAVRSSHLTARLDDALERAHETAFRTGPETDAARQFLQRVLYRINRLKLFWYDDLARYDNERSHYLRDLRERIETVCDEWEGRLLKSAPPGSPPRSPDIASTHPHLVTTPLPQIAHELNSRIAADLDPEPSEAGCYFRDRAGIDAYRRLLEIASLDALVEASQLSRTLGGASNSVHAMLTRMLFEEYGGGRSERKHSTYFASMLDELELSSQPEAYFQRVPWQVLAGINLSFLQSERKRYFLRYIGGLLYTEISTPAAFQPIQAAADRLGLHQDQISYWQLHIREDVRHGQWMLNDVALPLCARYPDHASELVYGYDLQRQVAARAAVGVLHAVVHHTA